LAPEEAVHGVAVFEAMVRAANTGRMAEVNPPAPSALRPSPAAYRPAHPVRGRCRAR
jgi:hypothetical protein